MGVASLALGLYRRSTLIAAEQDGGKQDKAAKVGGPLVIAGGNAARDVDVSAHSAESAEAFGPVDLARDERRQRPQSAYRHQLLTARPKPGPSPGRSSVVLVAGSS